MLQCAIKLHGRLTLACNHYAICRQWPLSLQMAVTSPQPHKMSTPFANIEFSHLVKLIYDQVDASDSIPLNSVEYDVAQSPEIGRRLIYVRNVMICDAVFVRQPKNLMKCKMSFRSTRNS